MAVFFGIIALSGNHAMLNIFRGGGGDNIFAAKGMFTGLFVLASVVCGLALVGTNRPRNAHCRYVSETEKWLGLDTLNAKSVVVRYGWVIMVLLTIGCAYLSAQNGIDHDGIKGVLKAMLPMMIAGCSAGFLVWLFVRIAESKKANYRDFDGEIRLKDLRIDDSVFSHRGVQRYNTFLFLIIMCCAYLVYIKIAGAGQTFWTAGIIFSLTTLGVTLFAISGYATDELKNRDAVYEYHQCAKDNKSLERGSLTKNGKETELDPNSGNVRLGAKAISYMEYNKYNGHKLSKVWAEQDVNDRSIENMLQLVEDQMNGKDISHRISKRSNYYVPPKETPKESNNDEAAANPGGSGAKANKAEVPALAGPIIMDGNISRRRL